MHVTVVGFMGATEQLLIMIGVHLLCFFSPLGNDLMRVPSMNERLLKDIV